MCIHPRGWSVGQKEIPHTRATSQREVAAVQQKSLHAANAGRTAWLRPAALLLFFGESTL
jgi:hypothetical protein